MQRLNTDRPSDVAPELKHKPIKGFSNSTPRSQAQIDAENEALEGIETEREIICDQDYEDLTDEQLNRLVAIKFNITSENFDPCNDHADAWVFLETFNCTLDGVNGICYAHNYNIRIKCPNQVLRASVISFLLETDYC